MSTEEEKETDAQEPVEQASSIPLSRKRSEDFDSVEQEPVKQAPVETGPAEEISVEEEPAEEETEEDKKKKYWWLSLGLILLLLGGGGFYAMTGMRQAAHKLGGGSDYDQLSANSSIYDGRARAGRSNGDYFPLDEEAARAQAVEAANVDRTNPAVIRSQEELVRDASGKGVSSQSSAGAQGGGEEAVADEQRAGGARTGGGGQAAMAEKLKTRAFLSAGPSGPGSNAGKGAAAAGLTAAFQGNNGTVVGKASEQRETKPMAPKQAGRGSVMESLKGAFKATFYGARLSSQDSAKSWIARSFDGSAESTTAIEYEEKMRSKLDKVNPGSIPNFLRNQDVSADDAKRLTVSDVAKPELDKEGTKDALAADDAYQKKKLANDFSSSMINGLFAGISGTGSSKEVPDDYSYLDNGGDPESFTMFADPEDEQYLQDEELQDYIDTNGFGGECGCSADAPCCCLPGNDAGDAGIGGTEGMIGDFPPSDTLYC